MRRQAIKNLLSFLLALVLTLGTVAAMSLLTAAETGPAVLHAETKAEDSVVTELSAQVHREGPPLGRCILTFGAVFGLATVGWIAVQVNQKRSVRAGRRYSPRADLRRKPVAPRRH